jgi:hypothetical protein
MSILPQKLSEEERQIIEMCKNTRPLEECKKIAQEIWRKKNKGYVKQKSAKRHAENKEMLNKQRIERAKNQKEREEDAEILKEILGPIPRNHAEQMEMLKKREEREEIKKKLEELRKNEKQIPDFDAYVENYKEDPNYEYPNSSFYDEQFSDIETEEDRKNWEKVIRQRAARKKYREKMKALKEMQEGPIQLGKRDRSESPVSEDAIDLEDFDLEDLDGGRKTRKRRKNKKTLKRGKKNRHTRNNSRK